jgi:hypothetical protein
VPFEDKTIFFLCRINCQAPEGNADLEQRGDHDGDVERHPNAGETFGKRNGKRAAASSALRGGGGLVAASLALCGGGEGGGGDSKK